MQIVMLLNNPQKLKKQNNLLKQTQTNIELKQWLKLKLNEFELDGLAKAECSTCPR